MKYENGKIVIKGAGGATCRIYDMMGRLVATRHVNSDNDRVSIPYANTYIVSVEVMGKRTFIRKISRNMSDNR